MLKPLIEPGKKKENLRELKRNTIFWINENK